MAGQGAAGDGAQVAGVALGPLHGHASRHGRVSAETDRGSQKLWRWAVA